MNNFTVVVPDKLIAKEIEGKEYVMASDEGEAVGIAAGYYYATNKAADVYISADGFMNALNPLISLVIPEDMKMNFYISIGRQEAQHKVATNLVPHIISHLDVPQCSISFKHSEFCTFCSNYAAKRIHFKFITKK